MKVSLRQFIDAEISGTFLWRRNVDVKILAR